MREAELNGGRNFKCDIIIIEALVNRGKKARSWKLLIIQSQEMDCL